MSENQNSNNVVDEQTTENNLPVFEGISPETVESLRRQQPELFDAAGDAEPDPKPDAEPDAASGDDNGAADEPQGDTDGDGGRPEQAGKTVPLAALQEERARRKELSVRLERLERLERESREMARAQIEHARSVQAMQQPKPEQPVDPLEHLVDKRLGERLKPFEEQQQRTAAMQETERRIAQAETAAREAHPDYDEVVTPVMGWLNEQAKKAQSGDQAAARNMHMVIGQQNPAEMAYTLGIRLRYEQQKTARENPGAGAPAAKPAPESNEPTLAQQEAAAAKAEAALNHPRGIEIIGSGGKNTVISEAELATMTPEQWKKLPADKRARLLRGQM